MLNNAYNEHEETWRGSSKILQNVFGAFRRLFRRFEGTDYFGPAAAGACTWVSFATMEVMWSATLPPSETSAIGCKSDASSAHPEL